MLRRQAAKQYEQARGSAAKRGYDGEWYRQSRPWLKAHPFCMSPGCGQPARHVDHIVPVREAPERRLDPSNWQALCASHHATKTAREDGGFGHHPAG